MSQPRSLSARDLQQRLQAGEPLILVDVREQGSWSWRPCRGWCTCPWVTPSSG